MSENRKIGFPVAVKIGGHGNIETAGTPELSAKRIVRTVKDIPDVVADDGNICFLVGEMPKV
jgi:hypothetical protein